MQKQILRVAVLLAVLMVYVPERANALVEPMPLATDPRIKTVMYAPNEVVKFTGFYRYQSSIEFAPDEEILTISLGDSVPWQVNPLGNRLFIKPIEQDATTNMTLITSKRTYLFELHAKEAKSISDKDIIWIMRFIYPGEENFLTVNTLDRIPDLEADDVNKYNFRYTIAGSDEISPLRIFDDGEFTYFEFRDINGDIPAFFQVDKDGNESIINFRTRGPYIVVERVSARYTLRHGVHVVCVYNEAMAAGKKGAPRASAMPSAASASGSAESSADNSIRR